MNLNKGRRRKAKDVQNQTPNPGDIALFSWFPPKKKRGFLQVFTKALSRKGEASESCHVQIRFREEIIHILKNNYCGGILELSQVIMVLKRRKSTKGASLKQKENITSRLNHN